MTTTSQLQKEIDTLKERNHHVEKDKAWETSWTRRLIILLLTYIVILVFFLMTDLPDPYLNSIVPTTAFVLSTSSLHIFKKIWFKFRK
jgi:hypothetical protein